MFSKTDLDPGSTACGGAHPTSLPWSLAARLTAWYAGSAFALILVATALLYWVLETSLNQQEDNFLSDKVRILRELLRDRPEDATMFRQEVEWEWAASQYAQVYVRILGGDGQITIETPGMSEKLKPNAFPLPVAIEAEPDEGAAIAALAGASFRALAAWAMVGPSARNRVVIQVALDQTHERNLLATYRQWTWNILGLAFICCVVGGYQIARRGIRPVAEITATAQRIHYLTLHERIVAAGLPAELSVLAGTFNDMLDRLEESFERLSRFSADIAHELRTPINNLRGEAEVALGKTRSPEEYREVLGSCLEECARLARLIDSLLFVARAESPETQITREWLDIGRELAVVQEFYEATATEAGVVLRAVSHGETTALLDRTLFHRAIGNVVTNALANTPRGGMITLTAVNERDRVHIEVSDTGCGIPTEHLPYLFDRFYRVDHARSTASGSVGLGLAIVKSIVTLHGGSIEITSEVGRGTHVMLVFPRQMTNA